MRLSEYFIPTLRETPAEAETISHTLMLRAGMIRRLTSGVYTYLPLGLRVIKKVENIVREEMNRAGAIELLMPAVQPAELWKESGRWDYYGPELLRFKDRNGRDSCLAPTHEEVITDLVRKEIKSYRQLPINLYQIQTKFRDEIRPRFGIMRAREFIMKDAYSFDIDEEHAETSYKKMYNAYNRIFERCGLDFRAVEADTGAIGGAFSHEFMVLAETGEDTIVACKSCNYAANLERAEVSYDGEVPKGPANMGKGPSISEIHTLGMKTVEEVTGFLKIPPEKLIKTILYMSESGPIAAIIRGDHQVNEAKLRRVCGVNQLEMAGPEDVKHMTGAEVGYAGPIGLRGVRLVADLAIMGCRDMVAGANRTGYHLLNVQPHRDLSEAVFKDIREITTRDLCPRCRGEISFQRGIEVGHIFKLGTKYSLAMGAMYLDESGQERPMVMGCYGIGIGRTVAAAIEQNHDELGIIWPLPITPFEVVVLPLQVHEAEIREAGESVYKAIQKEGLVVLLDDRDERAGVKFNDADLIGIPWRVTIGLKNLRQGLVELRNRREKITHTLSIRDLVPFLKEHLR